MKLNVLADDLLSNFIPHRASKVSVLLKFASQKLVLKFSKLPKAPLKHLWGQTLLLDLSPPELSLHNCPIVVLNVAPNFTSLLLAARGQERRFWYGDSHSSSGDVCDVVLLLRPVPWPIPLNLSQ